MVKTVSLKIPGGGLIKTVIADSFFKRFLGLMGRKESDYGLLLSPCNSVHTCFMKYRLDLLFLDNDNRVVEIRKAVKPWRGTRVIKNARSVLEFPASLQLADSFSIGTKVDFTSL